MKKKFDVIIIGGGIMGCSTALQLARRGLRVVLFDKDVVGNSPSGKSSAIIRQHYSNESTARMALYSLRIFQNFDKEVGGESGFTTTGFVAVAPKTDRAGLEANVKLQQSLGIQTELISTERLDALMPGLDKDDLVVAAYEAESGYADPYLTVTSYAAAAKKAGVVILGETAVTQISFDGEKVVGVKTNTDSYDAPVVVNCGGAWGAQIAKLAGLDMPIDACRVQVSFFQRPPGYEKPHPVFADFINATYFRSETGNLTLVGLIDPSEADAIVDPDNFPQRVDDDFVMATGERFVRRYPPMEAAGFTGGYASLYAITPDWHPIIDELPAGSGFYVCSGFSGHGFKLGPAVGVMLADLITGEKTVPFDTQLFRFARFAENDPVRGQYEYSIIG